MSTVNTWPITSRGQVKTPFSSDIIIGRNIACVASVSNRVTARKLEREQKRKGLIPLSLPRPFFFCSRPNFLDELARKRLLHRRVEIRHFNVLASAANTTSIDYGQSLSFFLLFAVYDKQWSFSCEYTSSYLIEHNGHKQNSRQP